MKLIPRLAWAMMSAWEREQFLYFLPTLQQSQMRRLLSGKDKYPPGFDQLKCVFVHIPKTAGTSVTNALFGSGTPGHLPLSWFQHIEPEKFAEYFKFAFVRNPWDRLVSGYTYMVGKDSKGRDTAEWIAFLKQFASFEDFVLRWVNEENVERHKTFVPQYRFVYDKHGLLSLDFIGRYENLREDYQRICDTLGGGEPLPHANKSERIDYRQYYSARTHDIVARVYAKDIELFNFTFDK